MIVKGQPFVLLIEDFEEVVKQGLSTSIIVTFLRVLFEESSES